MGAFTLGRAVWGAATYAVGAAIDHGRGRFVMTGGALLAGAGFGVWALVTAPWMLYAACALLSFPACAALISGFGWRGALGCISALLALGVAPLHAWALRGPAVAAAPAQHDPADDATLHQALREPAFWLLTLCLTLYAFAAAALWAHVMPALADKGFSEAEALAVLVLVGPAQVAGRALYALAGRGISLRLLGVAVLMAMPVALAVFALGRSVPVLLVFAVLFGIANGLVTIVRGGLVPEYFGRSHIGRIGGAMSAVGLLSRAAAPLLTAWLLLWLAGYREVMGVLALLGVGAAAAFALSRRPRQRRQRRSSRITSLSRRIWKRFRKLLPSSTIGIAAGITTALTLFTSTEPTRRVVSVTRCACTVPLAVCICARGPLR